MQQLSELTTLTKKKDNIFYIFDQIKDLRFIPLWVGHWSICDMKDNFISILRIKSLPPTFWREPNYKTLIQLDEIVSLFHVYYSMNLTDTKKVGVFPGKGRGILFVLIWELKGVCLFI